MRQHSIHVMKHPVLGIDRNGGIHETLQGSDVFNPQHRDLLPASALSYVGPTSFWLEKKAPLVSGISAARFSSKP
jgi:hypothetical protein